MHTIGQKKVQQALRQAGLGVLVQEAPNTTYQPSPSRCTQLPPLRCTQLIPRLQQTFGIGQKRYSCRCEEVEEMLNTDILDH